MKKPNIYIRLQHQYKKLNSRIQKSIQNGKFYQFTQFKQEQLLARLKRYSLQMKQVATGLAVVGALGVATPAVGQVPDYIKHTGVNSPFDNVDFYNAPFSKAANPTFVDIDNDGDLDLFVDSLDNSSYQSSPIFYENTGTSTTATFTRKYGAMNPLYGINNNHSFAPAFVDIDNDGDLDCFAGSHYGTYGHSNYYENQGTSASPNFVMQATTNNPLDSLNNFNYIGADRPISSFVDIDNDGDLDCFNLTYSTYTSGQKMMYYQNTGTITSPTFLRQLGTFNPLDTINTTPWIGGFVTGASLQWADMDQDGDMDAFYNATGGLATAPKHFHFFYNVGTATAPNLVYSPITPLDSIPGILTPNPSNKIRVVRLMDLDSDSDMDVFIQYVDKTTAYFENQRIILGVDKIEETSISIYPNPTSGILTFEKAITGELTLYNLAGQGILAKELESEQEINLSKIENGLYFLTIETATERIRKKVLIQK